MAIVAIVVAVVVHVVVAGGPLLVSARVVLVSLINQYSSRPPQSPEVEDAESWSPEHLSA